MLKLMLGKKPARSRAVSKSGLGYRHPHVHHHNFRFTSPRESQAPEVREAARPHPPPAPTTLALKHPYPKLQPIPRHRFPVRLPVPSLGCGSLAWASAYSSPPSSTAEYKGRGLPRPLMASMQSCGQISARGRWKGGPMSEQPAFFWRRTHT